MEWLTTGESAELVDVHASTVQRWCDDGDLPCRTTGGGHRRIGFDDLLRFAREREVLPARYGEDTTRVYRALVDVYRADKWDGLVECVYEWVSEGVTGRTGRLLSTLVETGVSLSAALDGCIAGVLYRIGEEWENDRLGIGDEHRMVHRLEDGLHELRVRFSNADEKEGTPPQALVAGTESNYHSMGALMVRMVIEAAGWNVAYLGAAVPSEEVAGQQHRIDARMVCVSVPRPSLVSDARRVVSVLERYYDEDRPYRLVLGGDGARGAADFASKDAPFLEIRVLGRLSELAAWISDTDQVPHLQVPRL